MATTEHTDETRYATQTQTPHIAGREGDDMRDDIVDDVIALYRRNTNVDNPEDHIMVFEGDRLPQSESTDHPRYPKKTVAEMARIKVGHPELRKANLEVNPDKNGGFNDWARFECEMEAEAEGVILSVRRRQYEL